MPNKITQTIKNSEEEKYQLAFVEYQTYGSFGKSMIAGRIEIYKIGGDIEKDKLEINNIQLPIEVWRALRKKLSGMRF